MSVDWNAFLEIIAPCQRVVITSHVRPDADAIGSEVGLCAFLEQMGKTVRIVNPSSTPRKLGFLDPEGRIQHFSASSDESIILETDAHIIVDTSAWGQLADVGKMFKKSHARKIVIDHHVSSDDLGAHEFKDTSAEASGTLIYRLGRALGSHISPATANALFAAIATDTGWFRFSSTTPESYQIAHDLVELGARPAPLHEQLYENYSLGRLKLISLLMGRVELSCDGRLAHTYVLLSDYGETQSEPADTEDLVNDCLGINGVQGAAIFVEQANHTIKVSFRSRSALDVARVAEQFKGGGHRQAAGAVLPGPIAEARSTIVKAMSDALQALAPA